MMSEHIVPVVLFIALGVVGWSFFYFAYQAKKDLQLSIQKALEQGQPMSPETIEKMLQGQKNPFSDFKRGTLLISLAVAIAIYGMVSHHADLDIIGLAFFPLAIGVAYLLVWKFNDKAH